MINRFLFVWLFRLVFSIPFAAVAVLPASVRAWGIVKLLLVAWLIAWFFIPRVLGNRAAERWKEGDLLLESVVGAVTDSRVLLSFLPVVGRHFAPRSGPVPPKPESIGPS